jgi:hypothetical protein
VVEACVDDGRSRRALYKVNSKATCLRDAQAAQVMTATPKPIAPAQDGLILGVAPRTLKRIFGLPFGWIVVPNGVRVPYPVGLT